MRQTERPFSDRVRDLFDSREQNTLEHALEIAAERYDAHAATLREQKIASAAQLEADPEAAVIFHPRACDQLAENFIRQAADARALLYKVRGDDELEAEAEERERELEA